MLEKSSTPHNSAFELVARPLAPAPDVPAAELEARLRNIRKEMEKDGLDAVVLTDNKNIRYFTDFCTLSWVYKARPVFGLITANDIYVFASKGEATLMGLKSRAFTPQFFDGYLTEAVTLLAGAICKSFKGSHPRIGLD